MPVCSSTKRPENGKSEFRVVSAHAPRKLLRVPAVEPCDTGASTTLVEWISLWFLHSVCLMWQRLCIRRLCTNATPQRGDRDILACSMLIRIVKRVLWTFSAPSLTGMTSDPKMQNSPKFSKMEVFEQSSAILVPLSHPGNTLRHLQPEQPRSFLVNHLLEIMALFGATLLIAAERHLQRRTFCCSERATGQSLLALCNLVGLHFHIVSPAKISARIALRRELIFIFNTQKCVTESSDYKGHFHRM